MIKVVALTKTKKIEYGIVIAIVVASFFISYGMRAQPMKYGMQIDEFDPYFNFRASTYLHENGLDAYKEWHDELSWYPTGRDVFDSSQVMLHVTAVTLYQPFQDSMTLRDFVILFPIIIGSLTVIPIFLLVTRLTNIRVGALATIFFAISVPFIARGMAGWFKSEPLGLFYGIFGIYFFISGVLNIFEGRQKVGIIKLLGAGIVLACGISAWGGVVFFFLPMLAWLIMVPGMKDRLVKGLGIGTKQNEDGTFQVMKSSFGYHFKSFLIGLVAMSGGLFLVSSLFARSGAIIGNYVALSLLFVIGFIIFEQLMNKKFKWRYIKTIIVFIIIVASFAYIVTSYEVGSLIYGCSLDPQTIQETKCSILKIPLDRYMRVLVPIDDGTTLSKSVAEHQIPEFSHIFSRTVFLMIFTPIGFLAILRKQVPALPATFAMTISVLAMYVGMSYVRLELFMSFGMIIMASIGIMYLLQRFAEQNTGIARSERQLRRRKISGYAIIVVLLATMMVPTAINWSIMMDRPALILYGASVSPEPHNDWLDTLEWIKNNTPEDAKIMAWWDYGYWIQTQANRTTYMDNGAYMSDRIIDNANLLTDTPENAVKRLQEKDADYVVFYVVGQKTDQYVRLGLGGDMAKMYWILEIGGRDSTEYFDPVRNLTNHFYYNTLYGAMVPFVQRSELIQNPTGIDNVDKFSPWAGDIKADRTIDPNTGQYYDYGWMKFELKDTAGMEMVYASDGIQNPPDEGIFHGVFVYKVPDKPSMPIPTLNDGTK